MDWRTIDLPTGRWQVQASPVQPVGVTEPLSTLVLFFRAEKLSSSMEAEQAGGLDPALATEDQLRAIVRAVYSRQEEIDGLVWTFTTSRLPTTAITIGVSPESEPPRAVVFETHDGAHHGSGQLPERRFLGEATTFELINVLRRGVHLS